MISTLRFSRIRNYILCGLSYFLSRAFSRVILAGLPYSLHFETAARCNLQCPECMAGTGQTIRKRPQMAPSLMGQKLNLHARHAFYCNLYFQGEPFLNKDIHAITGMAAKKKFYTSIATNGHFLDSKNCRKIVLSGLNRIIISLDGPDKTSHEMYRMGGDFDLVCRGIATLAQTRKQMGRKKPYIVVQMLVHKGNENMLPAASLLAKNLGADALVLKSIQIYSNKGFKLFLPARKTFNRYSTGSVSSSGKRKICWRLWSHMVYTSDGYMVPCCFDKIPEYAIGNQEQFASELWASENMQRFRYKVVKNQIPLCQNCLP